MQIPLAESNCKVLQFDIGGAWARPGPESNMNATELAAKIIDTRNRLDMATHYGASNATKYAAELARLEALAAQ
jgi:hypothetical protein